MNFLLYSNKFKEESKDIGNVILKNDNFLSSVKIVFKRKIEFKRNIDWLTIKFDEIGRVLSNPFKERKL